MDSNHSPPTLTIEEQNHWEQHFRSTQRSKSYVVLAAPSMESMALKLVEADRKRFLYLPTKWSKFPDSTDRIIMGGFQPENKIAGQHVLFLAYFANNDITLSQFSVFIALLQSFITSLTIVLPYFPVATMERVIQEGHVATANTYAQIFSSLPSAGQPTRLMVYDLHTLQNRFYLHGTTIASLQTTLPLLLERLKRRCPFSSVKTSDNEANSCLNDDDNSEKKVEEPIDCVAFPDDGAYKRFSNIFNDLAPHLNIAICCKLRRGDDRIVTLQSGDVVGKRVVIVDDLVQTGGTLYECGKALLELGAVSVSAFVAHAVFPGQAWRPFARGGSKQVFEKFFVTDSIPAVADELRSLGPEDVFEVFPLHRRLLIDLDNY